MTNKTFAWIEKELERISMEPVSSLSLRDFVALKKELEILLRNTSWKHGLFIRLGLGRLI
jgi:hypothetical protein